MPYRVGHATSPRTPLSSRRHFILENVASHRSVAAPFRKRSRLIFLFGCKRPHDEKLSLPTFCGSAPSVRFGGLHLARDDFFVAQTSHRIALFRRSSFPQKVTLGAPVRLQARSRRLSVATTLLRDRASRRAIHKVTSSVKASPWHLPHAVAGEGSDMRLLPL